MDLPAQLFAGLLIHLLWLQLLIHPSASMTEVPQHMFQATRFLSGSHFSQTPRWLGQVLLPRPIAKPVQRPSSIRQSLARIQADLPFSRKGIDFLRSLAWSPGASPPNLNRTSNRAIAADAFQIDSTHREQIQNSVQFPQSRKLPLEQFDLIHPLGAPAPRQSV